jgi:hypothetical protein
MCEHSRAIELEIRHGITHFAGVGHLHTNTVEIFQEIARRISTCSAGGSNYRAKSLTDLVNIQPDMQPGMVLRKYIDTEGIPHVVCIHNSRLAKRMSVVYRLGTEWVVISAVTQSIVEIEDLVGLGRILVDSITITESAKWEYQYYRVDSRRGDRSEFRREYIKVNGRVHGTEVRVGHGTYPLEHTTEMIACVDRIVKIRVGDTCQAGIKNTDRVVSRRHLGIDEGILSTTSVYYKSNKYTK